MMALLEGLKLAGGALLGGVVVYSYVQAFSLPAAREEGRQEMRAATLEKAIELVQERSLTNAGVQKLDGAIVCVELGGVFRDGICH